MMEAAALRQLHVGRLECWSSMTDAAKVGNGWLSMVAAGDVKH
jgi:hypothetical protein